MKESEHHHIDAEIEKKERYLMRLRKRDCDKDKKSYRELDKDKK